MDRYTYTLAGVFAIIASIIIYRWVYKFHKAKKGNIKFWCLIILGTMCILSGCVGIYKQILDGINCLVFGIIMFIYMKNDNAERDLLLWTMHINGWFGAIGAIVLGIIRILQYFGILPIIDY